MKLSLLIALTGLATTFSYTQVDSNLSKRYAGTISNTDLKEHLTILASDSLEGRETGMLGQKKAAKYIKKHFSETLGLEPLAKLTEGYFQTFPITILPPKGSLRVNDKAYNFKTDFYYFGGFKDQTIETDEVVFIGYGIDDSLYSDYKNVDVKGKVVLMLSGVPKTIEKKGNPETWIASWRTKFNLAKAKGVKAVLMVDSRYDENSKSLAHYIEKPFTKLATDTSEESLPVLYLREDVATEILGTSNKSLAYFIKKSKKKPFYKPLNCKLQIIVNREEQNLTSENVLGFIEGTDKKDEIIVLTAHYDHLGKIDGEIFYGADDDGSGTSALLELAEAFTIAKREGNGPRRSILIMPVSGEEKGLLGSQYYTDFPVFPLENTVANLNIDMIGRLDEAHKNNSNYIYLIGSDKLSTDLHNISEAENAKHTKLELDYKYNDENDPNRFYYRSDHWNFAKNNVPVIFYFNGVHADYHKSTDTVDKIDFDKMQKITRLVLYTAWELANREERIKVDILPSAK